ncbi:hypothetical protein [Streptomyces sp. NPDC014623]|uniref:hypothetical protein n=1 Tax=Streptomyces sp. NPDC014623 TaxID=3364875 RepID=UPI0036FA29E7
MATIATWSSRTAYETGFRAGHDRYPRRAEPADPREREEPLPDRDATVRADSLRRRRAELVTRGDDLPGDQLEAVEKAPGRSWGSCQDAHDAKVEVMQRLCAVTGRPLSSIEQREELGHPWGAWLNSWRTRRDVLSVSQEAELEVLPG